MDLPDEIICLIWTKLDNIDVIYSFIGVNKRFDRLVRDPMYIRSIRLTGTNKYSLPDSILDRYCLDILPRIGPYIECLTLEPLSMERIFLSVEYSRLRKLIFTKIGDDFILRHFTDESSLMSIFKKNITHVDLTIDRKRMSSLTHKHIAETFFTRIFHAFPNLLDLDFNQNHIEGRTIIFIYELPSIICYSSSLVRLGVTVNTFDDCLCLFDGRLPQLRKLCVVIGRIDVPILIIENLKILSNMRCFSLTSYSDIAEYDSHILPLICQMTYLEELKLHIDLHQRSTFIDGAHLKNKMLIHLSQLRIFNFNIRTQADSMSNEMYMQSNNDIHRTFLNWQYGPVNCYISHYPDNTL